jgi:hypothetical protein
MWVLFIAAIGTYPLPTTNLQTIYGFKTQEECLSKAKQVEKTTPGIYTNCSKG